jgi:hypothetical protein
MSSARFLLLLTLLVLVGSVVHAQAPGPALNLAVTDVPYDAGTALRITFDASADDTALSSPAVTRYDVYRSTSSTGSATRITQITATDAVSYAYSNTGLTKNTTYWYYVTAVSTGGSTSTARVSGKPVTTLPPAASNVAVADVLYDAGKSLRITWDASIGDTAERKEVTSYKLYRATSATGSGTAVTTVTATRAASYGYTNTGLTKNTTYWFWVTAIGPGGTSAISNKASGAPKAIIPSPPLSLAVADVLYDAGTALKITWNASASDTTLNPEATSYKLYRATSSTGSGTLVTTITATRAASYSYANTGLTKGTTYWFWATAVGPGGTSAISNKASAAPVAVTPGAPSGLAVADVPYDTGTALRITWNASVNDTVANPEVTSYKLYRATSATGSGTLVTTITATRAASYGYTNTGLTKGTTYWYWATAVGNGGTSAISNKASGAPQGVVAPTAASGVAVEDWPDDDGTALKITFNASSDDVPANSDTLRYDVYRAISATAVGSKVGQVSATKAATYQYKDTGLTANVPYWYWVVSVGTAGSAPSSAKASGTPLDNRLGPALNMAAADWPGDVGTAIRLTFDPSVDDTGASPLASRYDIYQATSASGTGTKVGEVTATQAVSYEYQATGLTAGSPYWFWAITVGSQGASAPSNKATATALDNTPPAAPGTLTVTDWPADDGTSLKVSFDASADDTVGSPKVVRYDIYRADSDTGPGTLVGNVTATRAASYEYHATGLTAGEEYWFWAIALTPGGASDPSNKDSGIPQDLRPAPPTGLAVADWPDDDGTALLVTFNASTDDTVATPNVARYDIYRAASALADGTKVGQVTATQSVVPYEYKATGLTAGTTYWFYACAVSTIEGPSAQSTRASGIPLDLRPVLPPSSLVAADHPYDTGGVIDLTWNRSGDDGIGRDHVAKYFIYRRMANVTSSPVKIGETPATNASSYAWADTTVPMELIQYEYTVTAVTGSGTESVASNASSTSSMNNNVVVFNPPTAFTAKDVAGDTGGQLLLTWTRSTSEGDIGPPPPPPVVFSSEVTTQGGYGGQYDFYRRTAAGTYTTAPTFVVSAGGTNNPMTYVDYGLTNGTTYYYKVRYRRYNQISNFTAETSAVPINNTGAAAIASVPAATGGTGSDTGTSSGTTVSSDTALTVRLVKPPTFVSAGGTLTLTAAVTAPQAAKVVLNYSINGGSLAQSAVQSGFGAFSADLGVPTAGLFAGMVIRVRAVATSGGLSAVSEVATILIR